MHYFRFVCILTPSTHIVHDTASTGRLDHTRCSSETPQRPRVYFEAQVERFRAVPCLVDALTRDDSLQTYTRLRWHSGGLSHVQRVPYSQRRESGVTVATKHNVHRRACVYHRLRCKSGAYVTALLLVAMTSMAQLEGSRACSRWWSCRRRWRSTHPPPSSCGGSSLRGQRGKSDLQWMQG